MKGMILYYVGCRLSVTDPMVYSKYKVPNLQNGHAYLTTHRACYVDNEEPRKSSVAVELKSVDKYEFYVSPIRCSKSPRLLADSLQAGFLKSSAKVTLYPKDVKRSSFQTLVNAQATSQSPSRSLNSSPGLRGGSPHHIPSTNTPQPSKATWVCVICSFSNPVPSSFDPATANANTPFPPCQSCGIKPAFPHVLKAAIAAASGRRSSPAPSPAPVQPLLESHRQNSQSLSNADAYPIPNNASYNDSKFQSRFQCPRCTFLNHPSLLTCELCGASLLSAESQAPFSTPSRPETPGPSLETTLSTAEETTCVKFSFRAGGEKIFHERLKGAMTQRKWLLQSAPPIPSPILNGTTTPRPPPSHASSAGIAGLERRGLELRQKNEAVIGSAFSDLDALMASAKEIIALAESFATQSPSPTDATALLAESAKALDMVATRDMSGGDASLYLSEMSRNLAEYLTDDSKGLLKKEGGIMPLVDLWSVYNRARGGVDLVSPGEFEKAARLWEKLRLPVRLRQFKNGLLVVQEAGRTDSKTVVQLLEFIRELGIPASAARVAAGVGAGAWFERGITAQEVAQRFGWSVGVALEELEMAEERDFLVRDEQGVGGITFWENWIRELDEEDVDDGRVSGQIGKNMKDG